MIKGRFWIYALLFGMMGYISPSEPKVPPRSKIFPVPQAISIHPTAEGEWEARIFLKNRGNLPALSVEVQCHLFREKSLVVQHTTVGGILLPREKAPVFCPLGKLDPGKYLLKVYVNYNGFRAKTRKLLSLPAPNIRALPPHIEIHPISPAGNSPFTIRVGYANAGDADAPPTETAVSIYRGQEKVFGPVWETLPSLKPGEKYGLAYDIKGLPEGKYRIVIQIDPLDRIKEKYEKDNLFEKDL
ncbi:MAG: CARDB domain-containing protein, partial [bacterium]